MSSCIITFDLSATSVFVCVLLSFFFFVLIRRPPRSTNCISSAASDVYKRQQFSLFEFYLLFFFPLVNCQSKKILENANRTSQSIDKVVLYQVNQRQQFL
eukprot:TRINITY_DN38327_c0_g1_i1.p1 TRINITY_DN38327_c0_g1~~TRINITY_DN38327_c0_g1_i1.p1  ORF type:complete len:100 (+),score=22.89 TRINITY_DN38327_c0_g1_i1:3-302(+)